LTLEQLKQQGRESLLGTKNYTANAQKIYDAVRDITFDPKRASPEDLRFVGKNPQQIERMLRADDAAAGGGGGGSVEPPPGSAGPPASSLKEGVHTTFKNGEVWTLQSGRPVKVR
jgi:hypothetical protein